MFQWYVVFALWADEEPHIEIIPTSHTRARELLKKERDKVEGITWLYDSTSLEVLRNLYPNAILIQN